MSSTTHRSTYREYGVVALQLFTPQVCGTRASAGLQYPCRQEALNFTAAQWGSVGRSHNSISQPSLPSTKLKLL